MSKRLLQMLLFIMACMAVIFIIITPYSAFNGVWAEKIIETSALQTISPQRLYISCWRNIKLHYIDPKLNNQDWNRWKYKYLKYIKTNEDATVAVNTMLASLNDKHSEFLSQKKFFLQQHNIKGNNFHKPFMKHFKSTTVKLTTIAGFVHSATVLDNSPSFVNPKKGDIILSINNYPINGLEMNSADRLLRGNYPLTKVEVLRNKRKETFSLVPGCMKILQIDEKQFKNNIVYISILSLMDQNVSQDFHKIMEKYKNTAKGFIIDLRGDIGGLMKNAVLIADEIIDKGEIVTIEYRNKKKFCFTAQIPNNNYQQPIVVLIDNRTASSSELLAGSLRSNKKAILVGKPSYGKNAIQQIIKLPNNSSLNLTTSKYEFGNNYNCTDGVLQPDYFVQLTGKDIIKGNDTQLKKACELINKITANY